MTTATSAAEALKAEMRRVTRCFSRRTSEQRSNAISSFCLTPGQKQSVGDFYYVHPGLPSIAFRTRSAAAKAWLGLQLQS